MTILDTLDDPNLLGAAFPASETWTPWWGFPAACFGLPMTDAEHAVYVKHTGRRTLPETPAREEMTLARGSPGAR